MTRALYTALSPNKKMPTGAAAAAPVTAVSGPLSLDAMLAALLLRVAQNDPTLSVVSLARQGLTDAAIYPLLRALETNTVIHSLDLSDNQLTDSTARALERVIHANTCLTSINMSRNQVSCFCFTSSQGCPADGIVLSL